MAGQLWIWGDNGSGLLGDNTTTSKSSPVQTTAGGSNWSNGSFGGLCAAAIKTDGTLWTWGSGNNGYLGDNTTVGKSSPVQTVTGGNNWSIVSCGYRHVAAIKTDGTLWLWGKQGGIGGGNNGGLGDNTTVSKSSPVQTVTGGNNWSNVSIGFSYSAAIKTDGTLWLWGRNNYGQLGDNTLIHRSSPVQTIAGGNNWNFVACGNYQTAAIKTDGTLWTWGGNNAGQLGDNTITHRSSPVQTIAAGNNWTKISCLKNQTAAIKSDGTLWLWGSNGNGELGDNTVISKSSPIQTITRGTNWSQVACGNQYTAATKTDGTLWLWGLNTAGKLGDNTTTSKSSPIQTTTFGNRWSIVGTGYYSTLAIYENTPSALSIATQPANAYTGQKLLNQPVINVVDSSGAIVQTPPILISVALASGSPILTGNTNILSSGGVVSYSDLALTGIGSGSLIFTASGLTSAISSYVAVEQSSIAIVPKRTETSGRIPDPTQLRNGELAINIADKKGYVKNSSGAIVNVFTGLGDSTITSGMVAENAINMREIAPGAVGPSELASGVIGGSNSQVLYNSSGAITGTAALTLSTTSGVVTIAPQNAGYNALTLRSFTSQSADLLKVQNSAGTDIARVTSSGEWVGPLGSGNIISGYIASGQIGINHLASGVISTAVLGSGQVTSGSIASGSVGQFKLSSGAVNSGHIGNAAVVSGSIASGSIGNFHLASGAVTSGEIGNAAVVSGSIASGSVGTFHIASGSITSDLIASGAIINADVADNAVTSGKIASGTIGTVHISSGGVQNVNIASGAVLSGNIASGQIGINHLASGTISTATLGSGQVTSGNIASGQIGINHLASGTASAAAVAGISGQVQFNAGGLLGASSAITFSSGTAHLNVTAQSTNIVPIRVSVNSGHTANSFEIYNSGALQSYIRANGGFFFQTNGTYEHSKSVVSMDASSTDTVLIRGVSNTNNAGTNSVVIRGYGAGSAGNVERADSRALLVGLRSGDAFSVQGTGRVAIGSTYATNSPAGTTDYRGILIVENSIGIKQTFPSGSLHVSTGSAGIIGVIVQGATSQTANLQEWQNSAGAVYARVNASGEFFGLIASGVVTSGSIASGSIGNFHLASGAVTSGDIGNAAVVSGSIASGSIGLFHFASGQVAAGGANSQVQYNSSGALTGASAMSYSTTSPHVTIQAQNAAYTPLIVKGTTSQTADLLQLQTSTGYTPFAFNVSGQATMTMTNSLGVPISMRLLDDTYGTVSWEGSLGQLFSISNNMTGIIFSVNDISGIPSIDVNSDGTVRLAQYAGNVGIRKATPSGLLDVGGDAIINGLTVGRGGSLVGSGIITNTVFGFTALATNNSGYLNTAIGYTSLYSNTTGAINTAIGASAMYSNTTSIKNVAVGYSAMYSNTTGSYSTAVGVDALYYNLTGNFNNAFGHQALLYTTGSNNTGVGFRASMNLTSGTGNVTVGHQAGINQSIGSYNTLLGTEAGYSNATAGNVVAVGYQALYNNTASGNVAVGYQASYGNTTGFRNISIGYQAGFSNTTGSGNIAIGFQALYTPTTGGNNIGIGELTLYANTTGYHNVAIGVNTMTANTIGAANTAVGQDTLVSNTRGDLNCAFGRQALFTNRSGSSNCAFGSTALRQNSLGDNNTAIGTGALYNNTTSANTGVGASALYTNTTGSGNIAVGYTALYNNNSGNGNTAIGHEAGYSTITNSVVAVGFQAMRANTTGYGTAIGYQAMLSNTTGIANTAVARNALYSNTVGAENTAVGYAALFSNISGSSNCAFGSNTLYYNTASENTGYGYYALNANTTGTSNTGIGNYAGRYFSTGNYNTSLGSYALYGNFGTSTGNHNVALGYLSQRNATAASNNTAVGNYALFTNQSGNNMVAVGFEAMYSNTTGTNNTGIGYQSLKANASGSLNTAVGFLSMTANTTGSNNVALGHVALGSNTTGNENTAVGDQALAGNVTTNGQVAVGYLSLNANNTGYNNTAVGNQAMRLGTSAYNNTAIGNLSFFNSNAYEGVAIGFQAARYQADGATALTGGNRSVYIGAYARGFNNSDLNSIVIGYQTTGQGANTTVIGNSSTLSGTIYGNINFPIGIRVNTGSSTQKGIVVQGAASQTANLQEWQNNTGTNLAYMDSAGNFYAVSKSFYIDHPTKPGKKLRHVCVEAPSADVYFRGKSNSNIIDLPDYWSGLVDFDTITVMLTPVGKKQDLFFEKIEDNKVYVGGDENPSFNFVIFGERKDIDKVIVED